MSNRFKALPMTKVEFVREDHIKEVAEKRRKCFKQKGLLLFASSKRNDEENALWRKFGLLPVSRQHHNGDVDDEMLVLEDLEYQLTAALREEEEGFEGVEDFTDGVDESDIRGDLSLRTGMVQ